jgi:hypothetical protein
VAKQGERWLSWQRTFLLRQLSGFDSTHLSKLQMQKIPKYYLSVIIDSLLHAVLAIKDRSSNIDVD